MPNPMCASMLNRRTEIMITNAIIDLSHWDESVDFKLAKSDGILGVIHKATQGVMNVDPMYAERRKAAEKEGLLWGAYHFGTGGNGKDQADYFLKTVGDTSKVLALDIEENGSGDNITPEQANDFVVRIYEITGHFPLIYGNASFLETFAIPTLTQCLLWTASWTPKPKLPEGWVNWIIWQYTDGKNGEEPHSVKGIGPCDRNKFNGTSGDLVHFWTSQCQNQSNI